MKIAITGGTGFVGRHLARALVNAGHEVILIARGLDRRDEAIRQLDRATFAPIGLDDEAQLAQALAGCDGLAHCAGINREIGAQTYQRVHVEGTHHVVNAARRAGVEKILLLSFLRARPNCGSPYHESKWAAEEIVRASGLDYTIIKAAMIYGLGDHMLDHLSHTLHTIPLFASVGLKERPIRPVAVEDVVRVLQAALVEGRLAHQTVAVVGPEEMNFSETVRRVAQVMGKRVYAFPMPVFFHYLLAWGCELTMVIPLVSLAQVRMLSEGIVEPLPTCDSLPDDLTPKTLLTDSQIRRGLPEMGAFGFRDCRWLARVMGNS
ncbi:MAG: SDR family NAD(P)-dependent oxidoreductase [Chloroflexi bacterium]|nr:SDR family NAD(P)-dependent oxidoreductase [Chloroflexota bacterium]